MSSKLYSILVLHSSLLIQTNMALITGLTLSQGSITIKTSVTWASQWDLFSLTYKRTSTSWQFKKKTSWLMISTPLPWLHHKWEAIHWRDLRVSETWHYQGSLLIQAFLTILFSWKRILRARWASKWLISTSFSFNMEDTGSMFTFFDQSLDCTCWWVDSAS